MVKLGDKYNFINQNDDLMLPSQWFDHFENISNGVAHVELRNKSYDVNLTTGEFIEVSID